MAVAPGYASMATNTLPWQRIDATSCAPDGTNMAAAVVTVPPLWKRRFGRHLAYGLPYAGDPTVSVWGFQRTTR